MRLEISLHFSSVLLLLLIDSIASITLENASTSKKSDNTKLHFNAMIWLINPAMKHQYQLLICFLSIYMKTKISISYQNMLVFSKTNLLHWYVEIDTTSTWYILQGYFLSNCWAPVCFAHLKTLYVYQELSYLYSYLNSPLYWYCHFYCYYLFGCYYCYCYYCYWVFAMVQLG